MRAAVLFVSLLAFWLLLSGQSRPYLLAAGVLCSAFVTWLSTRMGLVDTEGQPLRGIPRFLRYFPWLLWQIVLSNIDVARRVWSPDLPISPRMVEVPRQIRRPLATVVFANSITLTPGTVTVLVGEDTLLVHALTEEAESTLLTGEMQRRVKAIEGSVA
ncbi:MAG: Na+/H+ antiporter subunit E [Planctomycetota bacterium]